MIVSWIKDKLGITSLRIQLAEQRLLIIRLTEDLNKLQDEVHAMDRIDIDFDLHKRGQNTIVLTGCYKGRGYVQFYDIPHEEFIHYVERLQHERKHNLIRNTDCPPSVKAYFNFK